MKQTRNAVRGKLTGLLLAASTAVLVALVLALAACTPATQAEDDLDISDKSYNEDLGVKHVVIVGDDQWETEDPGRSDLLMLARLDFNKGIVTLVSIPRDTYYTYDGYVCKANHAYEMEGGPGACQAVTDITGVEVDDYVVIGFDGLESIVDYFGGIEVMVPCEVNYTFYTKDFSAEKYSAGLQTVDGWRAAALSRSRTSYSKAGYDGDGTRQIVDRYMFVSLMKNLFADPVTAVSTAATLAPYLKETTLSSETILSYVEALTKCTNVTVYTTTGPVAGEIDSETGLWLAYNDRNKWERLMAAVENGDDPATVTGINDNAVPPPTMGFNESYTIAMN